MIRFSHRGSFDNTERFLKHAQRANVRRVLEQCAAEGLAALKRDTPQDSGNTADAWKYEIVSTRRGYIIHWTNGNIVDGIPVVILLQYGHGTRSGTFVQGIDFINPALRPVFNKIAENIWKEVTRT